MLFPFYRCLSQFSSLSRRRPYRYWTEDECQRLRSLLLQQPAATAKTNWSAIADAFPGRSRKDVYRKWYYCLNPTINRDTWSKEEDATLAMLVGDLGEHRWTAVARLLNSDRTPVQCRHRWYSALRTVQLCCAPDSISQTIMREETRELVPVEVQKGRWSAEEIRRLLLGYQIFPNAWERIAKHFVFTRGAKQCQRRFSYT